MSWYSSSSTTGCSARRPVGEVGPLVEQLHRQPDLVAEVDQVALALAALVGLDHLAQLEPGLGLRRACATDPRFDHLGAVGDDLADRHQVVGAAGRQSASGVVEDELRRHGGPALEAELVEHREQQLPRLRPVEHLGGAVEPELEGMLGDERLRRRSGRWRR